ncbi:oligoribonuclease [Leucobacter sp. cx-328]|nr:oligoribonuclease [Leucobacter sp. cx-328]
MQYGLAADRNGKNSHTSKNTHGDRLEIRDLQLIAGIRATFLACPQEAPVSNTPAEQIVWIDCEMTGLDADLDGLCEIALIITDFDLKPLDAKGFEIIINPGEAAMEHMNDFVRGMHEKSGLLPKIASGATVAEAEEQVLAYVNSLVTKGRRPLVAGNTIGMDRRFIAKYMPTLEERLHYRSIDVSTIKELSRRWYPNAYSLAPEKRGGHRALADIAESIQELAYFRDAAMLPLPGLERPAVKEAAAKTTDTYRELIDDAIAGGKAE